ncbi:MAG: bifunctional diaminohydroxyphosphoribosylaminopyrimidine deaminase/5-amino-6-(5-phosphoribosylamino)uracil reductase RibD, partial [Nitrospinota bacterium]
MRRAFSLALQAKGRTSPNPMVGAVIVQGDQVVGEGYHTHAGADHAEIVALRKAGEQARGGTLVVNLEPCCHYGRTPPCTKALIQSGIARVVLAMKDPNPLVSGKGIAELRRAGIQVI